MEPHGTLEADPSIAPAGKQPAEGRLSSHVAARVTRGTISKVLAAGFALVILLLLVAGFIGVRSIQWIQSAVSSLQAEQSVTVRLIQELQGEETALSAVFYRLSRDPASVDRDSILADLDQTDRHIHQLVLEVAGTKEEPLWRELESRSEAFAGEARRLLGQEDAATLLSRDLFHRHDQVLAIVTRLIQANNDKSLATQTQIGLRTRELLQRSTLLLGACLLLSLICALLTVRTTGSLFQRMQEQQAELSRVSWHLLQNQESAARRFSHELHDELGQSLTALKANLVALERNGTLDRERLNDCRDLVEEAVRNVREISQLLRPTILDDFGLDASLRWLADRFRQRTGIEVDYRSNFSARLPDTAETHLYRIAQEALTNVARHSGATRVQMELYAEGERLALSIRDNGKGMPPDWKERREGLGLIGMQARAQSTGGQLRVRSAAEGGVLVEVQAPVGVVEGLGGDLDAFQKDTHSVSR